eukprot:1638448-Rhodomonas_salina.1
MLRMISEEYNLKGRRELCSTKTTSQYILVPGELERSTKIFVRLAGIDGAPGTLVQVVQNSSSGVLTAMPASQPRTWSAFVC